MKQEITEIGIATIQYDKEGTAIGAKFEPTMELKACDDLVKQLTNSDEANVELVFAAWFSKMNNIELSDHKDYQIVKEPVPVKPMGQEDLYKRVWKFIFRKVS